jgi:hypothetical protein
LLGFPPPAFQDLAIPAGYSVGELVATERAHVKLAVPSGFARVFWSALADLHRAHLPAACPPVPVESLMMVSVSLAGRQGNEHAGPRTTEFLTVDERRGPNGPGVSAA